MKDMIPHHHQALEMAELAADRTNRQELIDVAGRIDVSQRDEIEFMQQWLGERGEADRAARRIANSLLVNDHLLIPSGYSDTRKKLESMNLKIIELETSEVRKMDGGLTCMSLRF